MNNPDFNLDNFKKWMRGQTDFDPKSKPKSYRDIIGIYVESKVSTKKLADKIEVAKGDLHEVVTDFKHDGGTVIDVNGKDFLIEVKSGSFTIPRFYVREC